MGSTTRSAEADALAKHLVHWITGHSIRTIAAYVPVGTEPGTPALLDTLVEQGCRVLLPVVNGAGPLEWAEYTGTHSLRSATHGLLEPAGEHLGTNAIVAAQALLVPALAVDHRGVRLGKGAGHYDQSLPFAAPTATMLAVVRDTEFVPELPGEDHDVRVHGVLLPNQGMVRLPAGEV